MDVFQGLPSNKIVDLHKSGSSLGAISKCNCGENTDFEASSLKESGVSTFCMYNCYFSTVNIHLNSCFFYNMWSGVRAKCAPAIARAYNLNVFF